MHPGSKACSILSPIVETVKSEMVGQEGPELISRAAASSSRNYRKKEALGEQDKQRLSKEVCDTILGHANERFSFTSHLYYVCVRGPECHEAFGGQSTEEVCYRERETV
ncbi:unnamed protein product [Boreogadus saida]